MFVKLSSGLTKPFVTSVGVKQGCVLSPMIFNLFINDLPNQFDDKCEPVFIGNHPVQSLMFADDVVILSQSAAGLKRAIGKTITYFENLNLKVNFDKSQIMIFNSRGLLLDKDPNHVFEVNGRKMKVVK